MSKQAPSTSHAASNVPELPEDLRELVEHARAAGSAVRMAQAEYAYRLSLLALGALICLCVCACRSSVPEVARGSDREARQALDSERTPFVVKLGASWAEYYRSMTDLKQHCDFGIVGTVSVVAPAVKPQIGPVYQMVTVNVDHVAWTKSASYSVPATVTFEQTGGVYQNVTYIVDDDPLFQLGESVVVFFKEYSPGHYRVAGGPTGRFSLSGDAVSAVLKDGIQVPTGTSVTDLLQL
jgi:hypothetical protein